MKERARYWVVDGVCQVCLGDAFQHHFIDSDVLWCEVRSINGKEI